MIERENKADRFLDSIQLWNMPPSSPQALRYRAEAVLRSENEFYATDFFTKDHGERELKRELVHHMCDTVEALYEKYPALRSGPDWKSQYECAIHLAEDRRCRIWYLENVETLWAAVQRILRRRWTSFKRLHGMWR